MLMKPIRLLALLFLALASAFAHAQLRIDVTGVGANQIPIAIAPFANEAGVPVPGAQSLTDVIRADLQRSGLFRIVETGNIRLDENTPVNYNDWRGRGDALVVGSVNRLADGRYDVRFRLLDVVKQAQLGGSAYTPPAAQLRLVAHRIADEIYEKLTGDKGVFATRIAYVLKQGARYTLQVADADGFNAQPALSSNEPIISPAWSPDGGRLAYVSFESRKPVVYVHTIATGQRRVVANFRGSNSAPAWSPDGSRLAVTLTLGGQSQIYSIAADGSGEPRKLASSAGIDTEPQFSPDGRYLYFTSDRGGSPQIYRMPAGGGDAQRMTFRADYATSPQISPDGKTLAYIKRNGGKYQVAALDLESGQDTTLTDTGADESPSFAPNGKTLLYATVDGGRDVLGIVSVDGRVRQRLTLAAGDVREPTWGPFAK
ncbi:MAG TPA: Tol-Pal system beta propeller repeat protein TolB [Burkholderiaceae bacterium]|nr:Tol-Pal system beta propeller repeat protein TolB [Burkholderiaceae bacterium]